MGFKLSDLEEGSAITLRISSADKSMDMQAVIKKHANTNIAIIDLDCDTSKTLIFDGVQIDMEYCEEGSVPIIWHNVKIVHYKSTYILQVFSDGAKHNRRDFFRVGVSVPARLASSGGGAKYVMVRDLSLSGFSISDSKQNGPFNIGDEISVYFEDLGHNLNLIGEIVRIEEREDMFVYGLKILNLCKDLSSYINVRQRSKR